MFGSAWILGGAGIAAALVIGGLWIAKEGVERERNQTTDWANSVCAKIGYEYEPTTKQKPRRKQWGKACAEHIGTLQAENSALAARKPLSDAVTSRADTQATQTQVRIQTRYRTLIEKVPQYVPVETPDGVIGADDRVPVGALSLLDEAARGDSPDAVSVSSGNSYELASPLRFTELVRGYVTNLGIGHQNAQQLGGLQGWVRDQQALDGGSQ